MTAADHDVKPGDSQDEVCKCGHLHAEHYGKVATARCTVCEGPARPVEDREPVGEAVDAINGKVNVINGKVNALIDVLGERFGRIDTALTDMATLTAAKTECTIDHQAAANQAFARGQQHGQAEAFEGGRQQGDADRAGRGSVAGFSAGKVAGASEREAELLDQGWTPPGIITEQIAATTWDPYPDHWTADERTAERQHREKLLSLLAETEARTLADQVNYPTDYEVWRDALTLSIDWVPDGTSDEDVLIQAEIWRDRLINYPTISPAEADQAINDQIDAITETEAAADLPAKETPGAEADWSGLTD